MTLEERVILKPIVLTYCPDPILLSKLNKHVTDNRAHKHVSGDRPELFENKDIKLIRPYSHCLMSNQ